MMKRLSLKGRLILFFAVICAAVFSAAAFVSWQETKEKIDEFFDTYQMALARQLASADWQRATHEIQKITDKIIDRIEGADDEDEAVGFAVFDLDGKMVFHDNENGQDFLFTPDLGNFVTQSVDGEPWRIVWTRSADAKYIIAVGQELDYRRDVVWDMTEEFMMPWGIGIVLLSVSMVLIIVFEFMPLNRLARDLYRRPEDDLSPLPSANLPAEIRPLADAMNRLLEKIEKMLARERGFIADSAHELRSPLTALKVQLEVIRLSKNDEKTKGEALKKLESGINRCTRLVEQLLALSKAESSARSNAGECILWHNIVSSLADEYEPAAAQKDIKIRFTNDNTAPFETGNAVLASLIVRNLLDNAVKYSPKNAQIDIVLKDKTLSVINSDSAVPQKHLAHLGQRFYRPAGQQQTGSGLGLSIVSRIAAVYGCTLRCENTAAGFKVSICPSKLSS